MKTVSVEEAQFDLSISRLKEGSIFGALSEPAIQYLLDEGILKHAYKDDEIFSHGSKSGNFNIVLHGSLAFYKHHNNKSTLTRTIHFGEVIGFVSMIALHDHVGSLYAQEESLLLEVSSNLFSDFHDNFPFDFGILLMNLSRDMARTIRTLSNALVENNVIIKR
ncbi:MAG: cyclic nucleotide-binding domain-containing protein [Marinomonas sp.]|uniref:cyclic nucleotide-binding domain-containing protein n=1 Tax=Marinomonas sp. GJ51-6 TaxID=2992802 RepID=UPI002934739D|nr:cyclic nucleotide-binding domain-containing protein [Marinomonas sp. GJ51-6]WOD07442.1 cyclic nucleotide-binding domain-containing protein [Marinomonas sp. GJ51-6]